MKVDRPEVPSLYTEKKSKKGEWKRDIFLLAFFLLLMLLILRFINIMLFWQMTKLEIKSNPLADSRNYLFLGFSSFEKAEKRLKEFPAPRSGKIVVVSYFTPLNLANFLVSNRGGQTFMDIGRLTVFIQPGVTWIQILPEDILKLYRNKTRQSIFFGFSVLPFLFNRTPAHLPEKNGNKKKQVSRISYVENNLESSKFLKIPYIIYFYLPLLLILWMSGIYGKGFLSAFLYYLGMFFLFDFRKLFFTIPFFWLIKFINIDIPETPITVISLCFVIVFLIASVIGIFNLKKMERDSWGKLLIFLFIFLPFFLRF